MRGKMHEPPAGLATIQDSSVSALNVHQYACIEEYSVPIQSVTCRPLIAIGLLLGCDRSSRVLAAAQLTDILA